MLANIRLIAIAGVLLLLRNVAAAQTYPEYKLGPYSASHHFTELKSQGGDSCICHHHFIPKKNKIKGYTEYGKSFTLFKTDTLSVFLPLYSGEYRGKKGKWVEIFSSGNPDHRYPSGYVFFADIVDIEKEVKAANIAKAKILEEVSRKERAEQFKLFLGYLPHILAIIGIIILLSRFPKKSKPRYNFSGNNGWPNRSSSSGTSYSPSSSTSYMYNQPQNSTPTYTPDNSFQKFEFERRSSERASRINHILHNCDLNDTNKRELEQLRRDQNADNHFNSHL